MIINQNRYATGCLEVVEKNHEDAKGRIWKKANEKAKAKREKAKKEEKAEEREEQKDVKSKYYFNIFI